MAIDLFKKLSPNDESKFQALLKIVDNSLTKMHNIIIELTSVRQQEHKYQSKAELLNLEHIIEDVRLTLSENITAEDVSIKSKIEASEINFSRRQLRSILYNLVNNAIKFRSQSRKPEIIIATYHEDDYIVISVKDNGVGMKENKLEEIFSKYYRIENAIEGSGIGLYLVKEIVTNAGGKVEVQSEVDKGTEFRIYLKG